MNPLEKRKQNEFDAFRDFEQQRWTEAAAVYHQAWPPLTQQVAGPLLEALRPAGGSWILDLACGTGFLAEEARRCGWLRPVGLDFSLSMLQLARALHPELGFCSGDAERLPFHDAAFDAVAINFGLLHFARPELALREAARVLRRGGRLGFTVWAAPEEAHAFGLVYGAIRKHGTLEAGLPPGQPFFRFANPAEAERVLRDAGLAHMAVNKVRLLWRVPSGEALLAAFEDGTARTGPLLRAQDPQARRRIRDAILEGSRLYAVKQGLEIPMAAVMASGEKAG